MLKVRVPTPDVDTLNEIRRRTTGGEVPDVPQVASTKLVSQMIGVTPRVPIAAHLLRYVSALIAATHPEGDTAPPEVTRYVRWGASPRGGQAIVLAAKAQALLKGNPHVSAEEIRWAAPAALRHRIVLGYEAIADGVSPDEILSAVVAAVPEPKTALRGAP
jgi:MoxR-like ATPase